MGPGGVCPTYVGMNRPWLRPGRRPVRMPHVCGDEPWSTDPAKALPFVCPTYVGMNRNNTIPPYSPPSMPHVCGDEPGFCTLTVQDGAYAPHRWG